MFIKKKTKKTAHVITVNNLTDFKMMWLFTHRESTEGPQELYSFRESLTTLLLNMSMHTYPLFPLSVSLWKLQFCRWCSHGTCRSWVTSLFPSTCYTHLVFSLSYRAFRLFFNITWSNFRSCQTKKQKQLTSWVFCIHSLSKCLHHSRKFMENFNP